MESQTQKPTNSAQRLHDLLLDSKKLDAGYRDHNNQQQFWSASLMLPDAFSIAKDESLASQAWDVMRSFSLLVSMVEDVKREVDDASMDDEQKLFYLSALPSVTEALSPSRLNSSWPDYAKAVTPVMMRDLLHISWTLRQHVSEQTLVDSDFLELTDSIKEAFEALSGTQIDPTLRNFIIVQLLKIKEAIDQYRFRGATGLKEALASYAGSLTMVDSKMETDKSDDEKKPFIDSLMDVCEKGTKILSMAKSFAWAWPKLLQGLHDVQKLLP